MLSQIGLAAAIGNVTFLKLRDASLTILLKCICQEDLVIWLRLFLLFKVGAWDFKLLSIINYVNILNVFLTIVDIDRLSFLTCAVIVSHNSLHISI